jgi:hypothetical protein
MHAAANLNAQTYTFDLRITDANYAYGDVFNVYVVAYPSNGSPLGPYFVTSYTNTGPISPIYLSGLYYNFTGITPPVPDVRRFIYFKVYVQKVGTGWKNVNSEWFSYDAGGWTSASYLSVAF